MYALLSPAKRLTFDNVSGALPQETPVLFDKTKKLVKLLQQKSAKEIGALMNLSDNLAELNYSRYQKFFDPLNDRNHAIFAFDGDTYTGLEAKNLDHESLFYAQEHLGILSGLYGHLRPFDMIHPYRLEMGTRLAVNKANDLYEFWNPSLTRAINERVKTAQAKYVVNLASNEYIKALDRDKLSAQFLDIDFKERQDDGDLKTVGIHAKKARGKMARFMMEKRIVHPDALKEFDWVGYEFMPDLSDDNSFVFAR